MGRTATTMEENLKREKITKVWKDYATKDTIVAIEKAVNIIKPKTINTSWRKLSPDVVHDYTRFMKEPIKEIMKEIGEKGVKGFQIWTVEKFTS